MNKIIVFLIFLATSFIEVNAIDVITALKIYRDSPFNLSSNEKIKYEKLAMEGDANAAYKLGRYYLYCENTEYNEKIAAVYYYISRCFLHLRGKIELDGILLKKYNLTFYEHTEHDIFGQFTQREIDELKSKNDLLSHFILYHYYLNQKNESKAEEYKLLLDGKMPSRLLLPYEVLDKEYSVGVPLSQPHIEEDEFIVYKRLGLAGDGYSAAALIMAYYRFGSHDDEKKAGYLRNIWAYISSKFGYKGCEGVLKFHWKDSIENLFNEIVELGIIGENEFEYDYVMYNYYKFKKDEVNEKKYEKRLIKRDVDRILILQ